jgi:hypothetical protein
MSSSRALRPAMRNLLAHTRPMATASRHVSRSGYIMPQPSSTRNTSGGNGSSVSEVGGPAAADQRPDHELGVGELQGAKFKIEPLRRTGEDPATKRARLLCMLERCFSRWSW